MARARVGVCAQGAAGVGFGPRCGCDRGGAMNLDALLSYDLPPRRVSYTARDAILYALSLGCPATDLRRTYEAVLEPLPFYGLVLGHPGFWLRDPAIGIDWVKILHADQRVVIHRPLPPQGEVTAAFDIPAVVDKGPKGALIYVAKTLSDADGPFCTLTQGIFARGDGGCGDHGTPPAALPAPPDTAPTRETDLSISPDAAALYRLNGDVNPLHIDPEVAQKAGFDRPVLHGLCTFGMAGRCLPGPMGTLAGRFTAPVYPGETLRVHQWDSPTGTHFRATIPARAATVIDHGWTTRTRLS